MSDTSNLHDRVLSLIAEQLDREVDSISPEASFVDDLGADSIEIVELVMAIEDEFNITISDDEAEKIVTVKDALDKITEEADSKAS